MSCFGGIGNIYVIDRTRSPRDAKLKRDMIVLFSFGLCYVLFCLY